jgi:hypothetical protein
LWEFKGGNGRGNDQLQQSVIIGYQIGPLMAQAAVPPSRTNVFFEGIKDIALTYRYVGF